MSRKAMPESLDYFLYQQLKDKLASGERLQTEEAVEAISRLARYPFTIRPGDWFTTRPAATEETRPTPRCREVLWCGSLDPDRKEGEDVIIASLPHNYTFGPVYSIDIRRHLGYWQMLVEVPSIANHALQDSQLKSFVIISHGVTQWARWQRNTGDPNSGGFNPFASSADSAGGDPGVTKGRS